MATEKTVFTKRADLLAPKLIKNLQGRDFEAYYCQTKEDAFNKALTLIPEEHTVSWGGSVTIDEIGLLDYVKKHYSVIDRDTAKSPEERVDLMRQALTCDTFLGSVNAMSENGEFVNVDGNGNRIAAITFGPKSVVLIVGMNKVCKTLQDAYNRARTYASPMNTARLKLSKTPCSVNGSCGDCKSEECICSYISTTRMSNVKNRIKIILVGEPLGY